MTSLDFSRSCRLLITAGWPPFCFDCNGPIIVVVVVVVVAVVVGIMDAGVH